jgi:hypothetical protein
VPGSVVGLFVVFAVLIIIIGIAASQYEKKKLEERRAALAQLAERLGLEFLPFGLPESTEAKGFWETLLSWGESTPETRLIAEFQGFEPFGHGHSQTIRSIMAGTLEGVDWLLFDYEYKITSSNGKSTTTTTYRPSIVAAKLPISLPSLKLGEENFFTQLGEHLGLHDIHFESEEFNRTYRVHCQERELAFALLHPRAIEYLLQLPVQTWQFGGHYILLTTAQWAEPMEFLRLIEDIKGFVHLIPNYVEQDRSLPLAPGGPLEGIVDKT